MRFKEKYLLDFSIESNSLKTIEFESTFDAERAAITLWKLFNDEIQLLQIRIRFDKFEEEEEND